MGCSGSKLPDAGVFLKAQAPPASGALGGDVLLPGAELMLLRYVRSYGTFVVANASEETLLTVDTGAPIKDSIPDPQAFDSVKLIRDAGGAIVGAMKSAQNARPNTQGGPKAWETSYHCFASKPRAEGQPAAFSVEGVNLYAWACQTRKAMTAATSICLANASGGFDVQPAYKMTMKSFAPPMLKDPYKFTIENCAVAGGAAISDKTKEPNARYEVKLAPGMDGGLVVCCSLMWWLLNAEIYNEPSRN